MEVEVDVLEPEIQWQDPSEWDQDTRKQWDDFMRKSKALRVCFMRLSVKAASLFCQSVEHGLAMYAQSLHTCQMYCCATHDLGMRSSVFQADTGSTVEI